jgi:exodeoxyribonuclease V beta subunit
LLTGEDQLKGQKIKPGDIAILTESNKDCQVLQNLLTSYAIPSVITARDTIFGTMEAGEFLLFLQALVRMNNSSIKLLLLSLFFEFSPGEIEGFELDGTLDFFTAQMYKWRESIDKGGLIDVCFEMFNYNGFDNDRPTFEQRLLSRKNGERSYTNFRQILEFLHKEQHSSRLDTEELYTLFSKNVMNPSEGEENLLRLDKDSQAVQVMTMHASKGLEFPVVFFAGALKKDLKSSSSDMYNFVHGGKRYYDFLKYEKNKINQSMDLWEERKRLYYVALTRASSKLFMPYIQNCDFSYLSSLYSSFSIEQIKRTLADNKNVLSFSLPLHSGLEVKSSDKGALKKAVLTTIDDSIRDLVSRDSSLFSIDTGLEEEFLTHQSIRSLIYRINLDEVELQFSPLSSEEGFVSRYRKISSYSSIIRDKSVKHHDPVVLDDADRDEVSEPGTPGLSQDLILTRGAVLGELVHMLFEQLDYSTVENNTLKTFVEDDEVDLLFKTQAVRFFNNKWYIKFSKQLKELVFRTLKNEILPGVSLSQLPDRKKLHEMEFHMTVKNCDRLRLHEFEGSLEKGFLKGFIDLIFEVNGKVYIADWKTTSSPGGDRFEHFSKAVLDELMESHHYNLQSMIYMAALCKYLSSPGKNTFDYDRDFGGCFYLFVRGINGEMNSDLGIHFFRPTKAELLRFADQFTTLELLL